MCDWRFWLLLFLFFFLLDELLGFEEAAQVEDLPCGQTNQTTHGEHAEVQHTCVRRLCRREGEREKINISVTVSVTTVKVSLKYI